MVIGHYLYLQTQFGEDRCTQFRVIVVIDPQTNTHTHTSTHTHTHTNPHTGRTEQNTVDAAVGEWKKRLQALFTHTGNLLYIYYGTV